MNGSYHLCTDTRPTGRQAVDLFLSVGWGTPGQYDPARWDAALATNAQVVSVYDGEDLIGMTRVLSDGLNDTCITDVIVRPGYQGRGIGGAMLETVTRTFAHTAIYVSCLTGSEGFFLKCGLKQQSRLMALAVRAAA